MVRQHMGLPPPPGASAWKWKKSCGKPPWLARKLFNKLVTMKMQAIDQLTRPQFLRMTSSPLIQLFSPESQAQQDPPAVRAAWVRLYWKIVRKPKRQTARKH